MIGKLDPEERVMSDIPSHDWTQNEDHFFAWEDNGIMDRIQDFIETLDWKGSDNIVVEIGGSSVYEIDGLDTKWSPPQGTRKFNKDAFIIIKNKDRNPVTPSVPKLSEKELEDKFNYDTSGK